MKRQKKNQQKQNTKQKHKQKHKKQKKKTQKTKNKNKKQKQTKKEYGIADFRSHYTWIIHFVSQYRCGIVYFTSKQLSNFAETDLDKLLKEGSKQLISKS